MKITSEKSRQQPDFGGNRIGEIEPTGDKEQDFNKAMVALRDDNYEAFIDDLNTLAGDPKVKNLRDAIVDKFNSKDGVQVFFSSETDMPIRNIHPTQFEVDMEKSLSYPLQKKPAGIIDILSGNPVKINGLPLVVAEIDGTNYIIDGHHRWSQVYCLNPDAKMIVRILKSDMLQHPDDALKLVQMEIFVAKDGKELPQSKVESGYNLYTIDEDSFKKWCQSTMSDDAKRIFDKLLSGKDPIEYMWQNVETMRKEAEPTSNAHGREDMPQTDKVEGEFISPRAEEISESKKRKIKMGKKTESNWDLMAKFARKLKNEVEYDSGIHVRSGSDFGDKAYITVTFDDRFQWDDDVLDGQTPIEDDSELKRWIIRLQQVADKYGWEYKYRTSTFYDSDTISDGVYGDCLAKLTLIADCSDSKDKYFENKKPRRGQTTMKKLNITKERFEKSNYFKRKYGKLEYVSESGKLFKTNKGKMLKFKESRTSNWKEVDLVWNSDSDLLPDTIFVQVNQGSPSEIDLKYELEKRYDAEIIDINTYHVSRIVSLCDCFKWTGDKLKPFDPSRITGKELRTTWESTRRARRSARRFNENRVS